MSADGVGAPSTRSCATGEVVSSTDCAGVAVGQGVARPYHPVPRSSSGWRRQDASEELSVGVATGRRRFQPPRKLFWCSSYLAWCCLVLLLSGCYAPLHSPGIAARALPDIFRTPSRTLGPPLNFSALTREPVIDYLLGPEDILEVTVPSLFDRSEVAPLRVQVMGNGEIQLPLVGAVKVAGLNLQQTQLKINQAYQNGFIIEPKISVTLVQKATVSVLVLGQVQVPGVYPLNKHENDVGHALGAAQGLTDEAGDYIEVHKRSLAPRLTAPGVTRLPALEGQCQLPLPPGMGMDGYGAQPAIIRLPLRGPQTYAIQPSDVILETGDVVVVPNRRNEVFFVVGLLSQTNTVRFTVGDRERELGVGFILPRDREIDVVTAVAMAGYIDPIDSPTTVTVQRQMPDGKPLLIHVDLIKARFDPRETILVAPGDIIYLNPDGAWYFRRIFDRIIADLIILPYDGLVR